jgi:hypothetical protein
MLLLVLAGLALVAGAANGATPTFTDEQLVGTPFDDFWEPTTAADPRSGYVYQAVTGIGAHECAQHNCPGTSILVRASSNGGTSWGPIVFVCGIACKNVGWQFDPQLAVSSDGTVYAAWLNTFDPGTVLSKSSDHGRTWTTPVRMNGDLAYNDKPTLAISPSGKDVYLTFDDKTDDYSVASHDYGMTFSAPTKTNDDAYTYLSYGGTVTPGGSVYFAQTGEPKSGVGDEPVSLVRSSDGGATWTRSTIDTSAEPPVCTFKRCYGDFYSSQAVVASDVNGTLVFAYLKNTLDRAPKSLYVRTSTNGMNWSVPILVNSLGDGNMPALAAGPTAGDFRLVWQDDRHGANAWNTWFSRSTDGGTMWSPPVRLSNLGSGAPYKTPAGYTFPFGDYGGLAVDSAGTNFAVWGEGNAIYTGGGTGGAWWVRGR